MRLNIAVGLLKTFVVALLLMASLLIAVSSIPNAPIAEHVRWSMAPENYQRSPTGQYQIDYFTECVAATIGLLTGPNNSALKQAFLSPTLSHCEATKKAFENGQAGPEAGNYWRYWHGYQIITRPFLYFSNLKTLRIAVFIAFCVSCFFFIENVRKYVGTTPANCALLAMLCVPLYSALYLITHGLVWIVAFSAGAWLLHLAHHSKEYFRNNCLNIFIFVGMATSFFDLLTTPLITLTIPLLALYWGGLLPGSAHFPRPLASLALISCVWALGYVGCWAMKWVATSLLFDVSFSHHVLGAIAFRLSGSVEGTETTISKSVGSNLWESRNGLIIITGLVAVRVVTALFLTRSRCFTLPFRSVSEAATFLILSGLPFVWLCAARNHSIIHAWFVAPILYPTFALTIALVCGAVGMPLQRSQERA